MTSEARMQVVAEGGLDHLRNLERALGREGIAAQVVRPPPEHCSG
ncbi:MAG: hypothetical protein ACKVWV_06925 [Planctomycetota bacterium]